MGKRWLFVVVLVIGIGALAALWLSGGKRRDTTTGRGGDKAHAEATGETTEPSQPSVPDLTPVKVSEINIDGRRFVQMGNAFVRLRFQPRGGKCVSFVYKPTGEELTNRYGVFEEHEAHQSYLRSDFRRSDFSMEIGANDESKAELVLSAEASTPELEGVTLTKRILLRSDNAAIAVRYEMKNGSEEKKELAFWFHNAFGSKELPTSYFIPSSTGTKRLDYDPDAPTEEEWTRDPSRSWTAAVIGSSGIACITEFHYVDFYYNYLSNLYGDIEWRNVPQKVQPGESITARAVFVPFGGLKSVGGGDEKVVGEITGPGEIEPGAEAAYNLRLFGASAHRISGELCWRLGSERLAQELKGISTEIQPGQIIDIPFKVRIPVGGTCVLQAELKEGDEGTTDIVRTVQVGDRQSAVLLEPEAERLAMRPHLPEGRKDILYSIDVPTRHVPWGRPYYRGTMKIFVLSPIRPNGDTTGFLKRFDTDYRVVSCDTSWEMNTWGMGDHYGQRSNKQAGGRDLEFGYMTEDLSGGMDFDVMVIPTIIGWNFYPERARKAIIDRVEKGAGLVLINPQNEKTKPVDDIVLAHAPITFANPTQYHWYGDWQKHIGRKDYSLDWQKGARHFITDGVPFEAIPHANVAACAASAGPDAGVVMTEGPDIPVIAVAEHGKGRIAAINWYTGHTAALTPIESGNPPLPEYDYWEYFYSLLGRACLWAAGMEPEVDVLSVSTDRGEYAPSQVPEGRVNVVLENRTRPLIADVEASFKDHYGRVQATRSVSVELAPGTNNVEIPLPEGLAGGNNICDVIIRNSGYSINWGSAFFRVAQAVTVDSVEVEQEAVKNGEKVSGRAAFSCRDAGKGKVVFELMDPYDRVIDRKAVEADFAGDVSEDFEFRVDNWLALVGFVRAAAVIDGKAVCRADSNEFVVTPEQPGFTDYEVAPWGFTSRRNLWEVKARQFRKMGATCLGGINPMALRFGFGGKGNIDPHTLGIYYYSNRRQALQDRWDEYKKSGMTAGDKKRLLVRDHCLSKEETRNGELQRIKERAGDQVKYNPGTYYIGDESSLTSYGMEAELCYTGECLDNFRSWLKDQYGTLDALNTKWKTEYTGWSEIIPPSILEAQRDGAWVPWADHRTFMEWLYADNLRFMREELKKIDPNGEMELTGTQAPTSFNGMDWARHMDHVKRFVPYSGNFMWDMCRCLSPGVKMVGLTGYGSKGDGVKNSLWTQAFHGLNGANIFWEWSLVDADMTLSRNAEDIAEVFRELRGDGIGRLLTLCRWQPNDIAVHFSMPSIHAARLLDREQFPTACRNGWCQLAQDLHYQFDIISYLQILRGELNRRDYKVLILPHTLAMSPQEVSEIRKFVEAGGTLIADTGCGLYDDHCDEMDVLGDLMDRTPGAEKQVGNGRTIYLGRTIEWYPRERLDDRGAQLREEMEGVLSSAGVERRAEVRLRSGPLLPRSEIFCLENGPMKLLAVVKENLGGKRTTTPDGVEYFIPFGDDVAKPVDELVIDLKGRYHVYDVRRREYVGHVNKFETEIVSAEAKLYSLLPYEPEFEVSRQETTPAGESVSARIVVEDGTDPARHVFNLKVYDPEGERVYYQDRNIVSGNGGSSFVVPFALNAEKGRWKIVVRDVATGEEGVLTTEIEDKP